jgi:hypothetical protein
MPHMDPHPSAPSSSKLAPTSSAAAFALRFGIYIGCTAAMFQGLVLLIPTMTREAVVPDGNLLENFQVACLGAGFVCFVVMMIRSPVARGLHLVLASLLVLAAIREQNNTPFYQEVLGAVWMRWVGGLVLLAVLGIALRRDIVAEVRSFVHRRSFLLFLLGGGIIVGWAQVLSQGAIWSSEADRLVEEALEAAGYFFILCGVFEEALAMRAPAQTT